MKKFCTTIYFLAASLIVLSLSGCGGSGGGLDTGYNPDTKSAQNRRMVIKSPAFKRDGTYSIFRGNKVSVSGTSAKYYLAPVSRGSETIVLNLEYASAVSEDLPFIITDSDDMSVLFSYNPDGTSIDTSTPYKSVIRTGGITQKLKYTNLTLTAASVDIDTTDVIDIVLKSDGTATAGGVTVPTLPYVWHVDPQHPSQYWTSTSDSSVLYYEESHDDAVDEALTGNSTNGVYIAHDVRYTPNTLEFTTGETARKDEDTEYVVRYDFTAPAVKAKLAEIAATYGSAYSSDQYILASLPSLLAMGGGGAMPGGTEPPSGNPPSGNPPSGQPPFSTSAADTSSIPAFATMTHSASDAYANPVLHITEPGTYRLTGTWNGQIWVEPGGGAKKKIKIILNDVDVTCTVAPAMVFYKVYPWAEKTSHDIQSVLNSNNLWQNIAGEMINDDGYYDVGAVVQIADGTTNNFTGANVYRLLELCPKISDDKVTPVYTGSGIGSNISEQDKMYKLDGAFHSRRTMVIGGGSAGTGVLNITSSTYEGLDSEMHLVLDGGNVSITTPDDGINVNEDYVSVFAMEDGVLSIDSTGGDGIDSNGWVSFNGGRMYIKAGRFRISETEGGLDYLNDCRIYDESKYVWEHASEGAAPGAQGTDPGSQQTQTETQTQTQTQSQEGTSSVGSIIAVTETTQRLAGDSEFTLFPLKRHLEQDTEGARNIPVTSDDFKTVHRVNDFSGLTVK